MFLPGESKEGGAWWAAIYGVPQSQTRLKQLSSSSSTSNETDLIILIDNEFKKKIIKILKKLRMTIERNADYCKRKLETIRRSQEKLENSLTDKS